MMAGVWHWLLKRTLFDFSKASGRRDTIPVPSPRPLLDELKPAPCIGCGYCCIKRQCRLSQQIYGEVDAGCPALVWRRKRYLCRLASVRGPAGKEICFDLSIGEGCCSTLNSWRQDVRKRSIEEMKETREEYP